MIRLRTALLTALLVLSVSARSQDLPSVVKVDNPPNTPAQQAKHYVILVSLDGFRYDYPTKYGAPHLLALAAAGATAPLGMLPVYPSLTFPNHISIVTGLYPEHHGIVANSFRDPTRPAGQNDYVYKNPKISGDGTWYKGTPLWVLAEQQGMRAASFFWPGDVAEIQGKRPSYYLPFNDKLDDHARIDQIVTWLKLPPELRPHFIALYYSNVDHAGHAGHDFGPDSDQVRDAVHHTDDLIGELQTKIAALNLPVDIVVVADHGMINFQPPTITLSDYSSLNNIDSVGPLLYAKTDADAQAAYDEFRKHPSDQFSVYRRKDVPINLHYSENPREGDPVIVLHGAYRILVHEAATNDKETDSRNVAGHGFDPGLIPQMKAIFFAAGPDIKAGAKLTPFENVNIYPLITQILGLRAPVTDGKLSVLESALAPVSITVRLAKNVKEKSMLESPSDEEPVKIGLGVTPPALLHSADPEYTSQARKAGLTGIVHLSVRIEKDGHPSRVVVTKGLGMGLDESAVKSVSQSTFKPALRDGKPVVVEIGYEVNFQ